jgi:hypothetical protein
MNVFKRLRNASDTTAGSAAPHRSGWLVRAKAATQGGVMLAAEAAGAGLSVIAAPLAAVTGRLYIAVLVAAFGLGCGLRFVRLRKKHGQSSTPTPCKVTPPAWRTPLLLLVSAMEMALLVEATRWPVRADQPGFEPTNWLWVIVGFAVLFWLQRGWMMDRLHAARLSQ